MGFWDRVVETAESLDEHSYYELLGVERDATIADVEARFHALARVFHPDRHARERSRERQAALTRVYARLNEAARILGAPETRRAYDESLDRGEKRLDPDAKPKGGPRDTRDPRSPSARSLFDQARRLFAANNLRGARAKLALARQLEPGSAAIAGAIAEIDVAEGKTRPPDEATTAAKAPGKPAQEAPAKQSPAITKPAGPEENAPGSETAPGDTPPGAPSRRHKRVPLRQTVSVTTRKWSTVEKLVTEDVSRGGTFLSTRSPLPIGTQMTLRIAAPDGSVLELGATVVWVSDGSTRSPGMGLQFEDLDDRAQASLEQIVEAARAESVPGVEELVETLARAARLGPALFGLGPRYTAQQLDDAFLPLAVRYAPDRFPEESDERRIAGDLAEALRSAYQAASRGSSS